MLIQDLTTAEITLLKDTSYEKLSASEIGIDIHPGDSGRDVEFVEKDKGIHLSCSSRLTEGPGRIFLGQVPGLPQIRIDDSYSFPRISQARKEALKSSMDEVR